MKCLEMHTQKGPQNNNYASNEFNKMTSGGNEISPYRHYFCARLTWTASTFQDPTQFPLFI